MCWSQGGAPSAVAVIIPEQRPGLRSSGKRESSRRVNNYQVVLEEELGSLEAAGQARFAWGDAGRSSRRR